jgi:hypothetical protein
MNVRRVLKLGVAGAVCLAGCRRTPSEVRAQSTEQRPPPIVEIGPGELDAYRRGISREIALTRQALERPAGQAATAAASVSDETDRSRRLGAEAAGLSFDRYEQVVGEVDRWLRSRAGSTEAVRGPPARAARTAATGQLDSLRTELMVLRSRLEAAQESTN